MMHKATKTESARRTTEEETANSMTEAQAARLKEATARNRQMKKQLKKLRRRQFGWQWWRRGGC